MRDHIESLSKVKVKDDYCSPLIHKPIMESVRAGQAWFSLGKSMLTVPSSPLLLHVPKNMFQEDSTFFPRTPVEMSNLWFPGPSLWQLGAIFAFHCGGLSMLSSTFQRWEKSLTKVSGSSQHPQMQPSGPLDLYGSRCPSWSLTQSWSTAGVLLPEPFPSTEIWETFLRKTETKNVPSTSASSVLVQPCY